ncbi:platelet binding protein GspB [Drosophila montana]|uniref:platelet binding protein GspB n=1 Tax=Drosophila montana TaxID=40370 RepID=UPI00313E0024
MLSKMAQPNNVGGGGAPASGGRRVPMSLTGAGAGGTTVSRLQQSAGTNGRSNSPQNSNMSKKNESNVSTGPFVAIKKSSATQQRSPSTSSTASTASSSSASKDDEKKGQNGINKSTNSNQKSAQNGSSSTAVREQQKPKEKQSEKKEPVKPEVKDEAAKPVKSETKPTAPPSAEAKNEVAAAKKIEAAATKKVADVEVIDLDNEPVVAAVSNTPTSERKSSRRVAAAAAASQQKSPGKPQQSDSPSSKKQPQEAVPKPEAVEDVEMESLTVDASPIRHVASTQPTATSTPGRNLFGFRSSSSSKPTNEVELAAQPSSSPATAPARSFAQISGRRSIRPTATLTPGKLGSYRCINSDLDTSSCTNTSMNATVGSEIPNSSSFSFSFFGRGRKRERTPPPLTGSQSANDLAQDVEMSPPKRARFDLFSLNLASPFTMLRSRFSKTTISTPSSRQRHDQTPPAGDDDEVGGVQNVSGTINQEEEQHLNKSSDSNEVTVGQEAGLETPKKSGTPAKDVVQAENVEGQGADDVANLAADVPVEGEGPNRSRCAIM